MSTRMTPCSAIEFVAIDMLPISSAIILFWFGFSTTTSLDHHPGGLKQRESDEADGSGDADE